MEDKCHWCSKTGHEILMCPTAPRCGFCRYRGHYEANCFKKRNRGTKATVDPASRRSGQSGQISQSGGGPHCKKKPDDYPAQAGLPRTTRIEPDFYPADSHPDGAGKKSGYNRMVEK